jgi:hypothetical protein
MQSSNKKSGFSAAFFYISIWCSILFSGMTSNAHAQLVNTDSIKAHADELRLSSSSTWKALLHANDEHPNIKDHDFLLSHAKFSLSRELELTIDFLYLGDETHVCRFPARYLWLQKQLNSPKLNIEQCADLLEFKSKAPAERISLSFASENLSQPSSTMGHLFLKLDGVNANGYPVTHAISFFTDGDSVNFPKLLFESTVIGKKGYFTLSPYKEKLDLYVKEEQRSVWEYELKLNSFQRELIQNHLIELKQSKLVYFFQKYNCSTVIDFIVALALPETNPNEGLWISPKDVVKRAHQAGIISNTHNISPNRWIIRALNDQLGNEIANRIKSSVDQFAAIQLPNQNIVKSDNSPNEVLEFELARAYHDYRFETNLISKASWEPYSIQLNNTLRSKYPNAHVDTSNYKNPVYTPQDSQVSMGITHRNKNNYARLSFLPASHHLEDDNSQYFGENSMQLFETSVLKNLNTSEFLLDRLTLFKVQSFIPHNNMTGGLSGKLNIAYEPQYDADLQTKRAFVVSGAFGKTTRVARDIDLYATLGLGVSFKRSDSKGFSEGELGVIARELWNMKTILSISSKTNLDTNKSPFTKWQLLQSKYFNNPNYSIHFSLSMDKHQDRKEKQVDLILKRIF